MKPVIVLIAVGIAAFLLYKWVMPRPSPYAGLPLEFQKGMEEAGKKVDKEFNSEFGEGARAVCRHRLGIKEHVKTSLDVVELGYGSDKAIAFMDCVVDTMSETRR